MHQHSTLRTGILTMRGTDTHPKRKKNIKVGQYRLVVDYKRNNGYHMLYLTHICIDHIVRINHQVVSY